MSLEGGDARGELLMVAEKRIVIVGDSLWSQCRRCMLIKNMYKRRDTMKKSAFSLIELMIVVAIIAFLAMVSVPTFMRFLAKATRAEA